MAIKSGFFNSEGGDRKYDAEDVNSFFGGVLVDGVLSTIGDIFLVSPSSGMQIVIGSGKAWFLKSWIENTSDAFLTLSGGDVTYDRIDIIALDFDKSDQVRLNNIIIVEGTPSGTPTPPSLINTSTHLQKPLAHILVEANETVIEAGDITIKVDTVDCPFSQGIVDLIINVDDVTIEIIANELRVKGLGIDTAQIAADAVTGAKIEDSAIDSEHITDFSIDRVHLVTDIIDGTKIANDVINSEHYVAGSIDNEHIADDAVNSEHYAAASIDTEHLADNIVNDTKVGNRVPMFTKRQGGSPTIWSTFGNNNYTPTTVKIQGGVKNIGSIDGGVLSATITITFPEAFAYNPIIQLTAYGNVAYGFVLLNSISTTAITFTFLNHGIMNDTFTCHWLAIGQE